MIYERGADDIDVSGRSRPVLCFVMPKLRQGRKRAASAAYCCGVSRHSSRYLELSRADYCEILGELQECFEVIRLRE